MSPAITEVCPYKECTMTLVHGHGTPAKYLPKPTQNLPEVVEVEPSRGSLDEILWRAFRAGMRAQFGMGHMPREEEYELFRDWKNSLLP